MSDVTLHWSVSSAERLREIATAPPPEAAGIGAATRSFHRDLYLDTPDAVLRSRGASCRLRQATTGRATLTLTLSAPDDAATTRFDARVRADDVAGALAERNGVVRRLRGLVDPVRLGVRLELEVERIHREVVRGWLRRPVVRVHYDIVRIRRGESVRSLQQVTVHAAPGIGAADAIVEHFDAVLGLRRAEPVLHRAELLAKWMPRVHGEAVAPVTGDQAVAEPAGRLHPEVSFLESQARVLAMAEDPHVPLAERLRFVAIVAANLDEFFMVRVAGMKAATTETAEEAVGVWGDRAQQLTLVAAAVRRLQARHYAAARACVTSAAEVGVRLRRWSDLTAEARADLATLYREDIHPALTPLAMTMSPGHPFPRVPHLALSMAVMLEGRPGDGAHFAEVEIPAEVPRLIAVAADGAQRDYILVEEVIRAHLPRLYPDARIASAHCFRVTRGNLLAVDEAHGSDLLQSMADATRQRSRDTVVRIEMEESMPELLRDLVVAQVRLEAGAAHPLTHDDVHLVAGPLDLAVLGRLEIPNIEGMRYPPLHPVSPVPPAVSMVEAIAAADLLVHHPFESFADTVVRFLEEAAADPAVTTIRMTLYRLGDDSPIAEALRAAAAGGKQVYAFVELRARFEEERNVKWVRALERAGVHVVYGLVGLKTHAKAALIVRREGSRLQRYVHVGSGNYNARTGLLYTDLSLFTCDDGVATEVGELFNSLTGSSVPLERSDRACMIAPAGMLAALVEHIEREAAHARAGRPAAIRIKVNGLSDEEVVAALEAAAADGVRVELVVRGICTLRPRPAGEPGHVRVVAGTGRFLEHSRIYHFANGGEPRYFIGSADLRPRNLRRRVELLAPVTSKDGQRRLDELLSACLGDPAAWVLGPDGSYARPDASAPGVQELLLQAMRVADVPKAKWQHALNGGPR